MRDSFVIPHLFMPSFSSSPKPSRDTPLSHLTPALPSLLNKAHSKLNPSQLQALSGPGISQQS
jgi:hypothetical protein